MDSSTGSNDILKLLIDGGICVKAKRVCNIIYVNTGLFKVFAATKCFADPTANFCYPCKEAPRLSGRNELLTHSHR
jgi:hypothetical protein